MSMISRLCQCGCGTIFYPSRGRDHKFIRGHYGRGRLKPVAGYRVVNLSTRLSTIHRVRAEKALGKPLPPKVVVHHADGSRSDDAPLVICQDQKYHFLLHARMRVQAAGGNPNTDALCGRCRLVLPRAAFFIHSRTPLGINDQCRACNSEACKERKARKKARLG